MSKRSNELPGAMSVEHNLQKDDFPKKLSQEEDTTQRATHPVSPEKVNKGDLMAFVYYAHIAQTYKHGTLLECTGRDKGLSRFTVDGAELIVSSMSADQFHEEKPATMTQLAELLVASVNRPLKVWFVKADGEPRVLRGRLVSAEPLLGRSYCEDLDIAHDDKKGRLRLVDHRTLQALVVDGVKYTLKGKKK